MSRFHEAFFMATHNSFQVGLGLSIREQLDIGVRCLELDLNVGNYAAVGDFQIGHEDPGVDVLGGMGEDLLDDRPPIPAAKANPQRLAPFKEWIGVAAQWSRQNPGHAPLTIYLDLKDNLAGRAAGQGSLDDVDQAIEDVFGGSLFARRDLHGAWPDVAVLAGRVLCVLSGSPQSRFAYSERVLANQAAFLELQGDDLHLFVPPATLDRLRQNALFVADSANFSSFIGPARANGRATRTWGFGVPHDWQWGNARTRVVPTFPAIDTLKNFRHLYFCEDLGVPDLKPERIFSD